MKILIYDKRKIPIKVLTYSGECIPIQTNNCIIALLELAETYPGEIIGWCELDLQKHLELANWEKIFHHNLIMASYNYDGTYLPKEIGYVEESPFIKISKNVSYPTWQMSALVGGIHASALLQFKNKNNNECLAYFLTSVAKLGQKKGLLCYSEPGLVRKKEKVVGNDESNSLYHLFRFVRQHYKVKWVILLFINFIAYQHRLPWLPFLHSFWFRSRRKLLPDFSHIKIKSTRNVIREGSLDVIIPTIGRKDHLYQVLYDLKNQTRLPTRIIIVEQNPVPGSTSNLDYLNNENWPFKIKLIFTHQTGVCNARNLALEEVESEWIFFNDDDNRFNEQTIAQVFNHLKKYGALCCITALNNNFFKFPFSSQSTTFGSGYSFISSHYAKKIKFSKELEFGYGEDKDYGMRIRKMGVDILYFSSPNIKHLNAPIGGFRFLGDYPWSKSLPVPKPSPTLMWYKKQHLTEEQILGFKTVFFINMLKREGVKNFWQIKRKWQASLDWSSKL